MGSLLLALVLAAPVYESDFAAGAAGWKVMWVGNGSLQGQVDPGRRGPSGAPSWRTTAVAPTTGTAGIGLRVGDQRSWRIELQASGNRVAGSTSLALKCLNAAGQQVDWIGVSDLEPTPEFRRVQRLVSLPATATQVEVLILHSGWQGELWVADVRITPFEVSGETLASWKPAGPTRWGATGVARGTDATLRDTGLKLLAAAGLTQTRLGIDWRRAEPEPGKLDFSALDEALAELARYGLRADVVFINGTPPWAHGKTVEDMLPERRAKGLPWTGRAYWAPRDWAAWERFVQALVTHFRGRVPVWEILNEPDLWSEGFNGTYDEYVEYLRRASQVAKAADPACRVYCAAFVHDQWLGRLLADGHAALFDGVCIHPYHSQPAGVLSRARKMQLELLAAGVQKPLAVTEVGYQSGGWKEGPGVKQSEDEKAAAGREALALLTAVSDNLVWYTAIERGNMYGLLRDDGDRYRPVAMYWEYGKLTGRLTGAAPLEVTVERRGEQLHLAVRNTAAEPVAVRCWPVGLVTALGAARGDWAGDLPPGGRHEINLPVRPAAGAKGDYAVGLAVLSAAGNAVKLIDWTVEARP